jgi:hypothetical protein
MSIRRDINVGGAIGLSNQNTGAINTKKMFTRLDSSVGGAIGPSNQNMAVISTKKSFTRLDSDVGAAIDRFRASMANSNTESMSILITAAVAIGVLVVRMRCSNIGSLLSIIPSLPSFVTQRSRRISAHGYSIVVLAGCISTATAR